MLERVGDVRPLRAEPWIWADNDVLASRKRLADGIPRFAAPDDAVADGQVAQMVAIFGRGAGRGIIDADDVVFGVGGDQRDVSRRCHVGWGDGAVEGLV